VCGRCLADPPGFDASFAAADYAPPVDRMVLALKFSARLEHASLFADLIFKTAHRMNDDPPALLTAVPLGALRLRERGFSQALEIAKPLARKMKLPLLPRLIFRNRETAAQSGLRPADRRRNIRAAFSVHPDALALIAGRHVGVVDDVLTTGETLHELASTLKRFGARKVSNFVFARTPE
jgi:ComF family protein